MTLTLSFDARGVPPEPYKATPAKSDATLVARLHDLQVCGPAPRGVPNGNVT